MNYGESKINKSLNGDEKITYVGGISIPTEIVNYLLSFAGQGYFVNVMCAKEVEMAVMKDMAKCFNTYTRNDENEVVRYLNHCDDLTEKIGDVVIVDSKVVGKVIEPIMNLAEGKTKVIITDGHFTQQLKRL